MGFTGSGHISLSGIDLRGIADEISFGSHKMEDVRIEISSMSMEVAMANISFKEIVLEDAQGELLLSGSLTKFSGAVDMQSVSGSLLMTDMLELEGAAKSIAIPDAGIKIG